MTGFLQTPHLCLPFHQGNRVPQKEFFPELRRILRHEFCFPLQ